MKTTPKESSVAQRAKNAAYMREWNRLNRERINRERRAKRLLNRDAINKKKREYDKKNPDKKRSWAQKTYRKNHSANIARQRNWRAKNVLAHRQYNSAYAKAHPEINKKAREVWFEKDPEHVRQLKALNKKKHPESIRAGVKRYRARKLGAPRCDLTKEQESRVIALADGVCAYCKYYKQACGLCDNHAHILNIDHIKALNNGGAHTLYNVIAVCRSCNSKKKTNPPPWITFNRYY